MEEASSKTVAKTEEDESTSSLGVGSSVGGGVGLVDGAEEEEEVELGVAKEEGEARDGEEEGDEKSMKERGEAEGLSARSASAYEPLLLRRAGAGGGGVVGVEVGEERLTEAVEEPEEWAGGVRDWVTSPLFPSPRRAEGERAVDDCRRAKRGAGEMPR